MGEPRTITLTLRATVAAVVVAVLLLGLLAAQLVFIAQQRGIVDHQRDIAKRQAERSAPVLGAAEALIGDPEAIRAAAAEAGQTLQRLRGVLRRTPELLADVNRAVAILQRTHPTLRASLEIQQDTRSLTSESLDVQRRSLDVQRQVLAIGTELRDITRQVLVHAESIDSKTGGTAPPVLP